MLPRHASKPYVRNGFVVESGCAGRPRDRCRKNARSAVATSELERWLPIERRAPRYDRGNRLRLSTNVHYSFAESANRPASTKRSRILRCAFLAVVVARKMTT